MTAPQPTSHSWRNRTARDITAVIMAAGTAAAILILTAASILDAWVGRGLELSPAYTSLLTGTLGVMVGAIAAYLGGRANDPESPAPAPPIVGPYMPATSAGDLPPAVFPSSAGDGLSEPNNVGRHAVDAPTESLEVIDQ